MANEIKIESISMFRTQAETVRQLAKDMNYQMDILENLISRTRYYWIGDAGNAHRKLYEKQKEGVVAMIKQAYKHPDALEAMAGNYVESVNKSETIVVGLKKNIYTN